MFEPLQAVSNDELEAIHDASLRVLEEIGIDFLHDEAKAILKKAGADVETGSDRVRMDRGLIEETISTCPPEFTMHARSK